MDDILNLLTGKHRMLGLAYPTPIQFMGEVWPSAAAALIAASSRVREHDLSRLLTLGHARSAVNPTLCVHYWRTTCLYRPFLAPKHELGLQASLEAILRVKFSDPEMMGKLLDTDDALIIDAVPHTKSGKRFDLNLQVSVNNPNQDSMRTVALAVERLNEPGYWTHRGRPAVEGEHQAEDEHNYSVRLSARHPSYPAIFVYSDDKIGYVSCQTTRELVIPLAELTPEKIEELKGRGLTKDSEGQYHAGLNVHGKILMKLRDEIRAHGRLLS